MKKFLCLFFSLSLLICLISCDSKQSNTEDFTPIPFEEVKYEYDFEYYRHEHPYVYTDYYAETNYTAEFRYLINYSPWKIFLMDQFEEATGGCAATLINFEIVERNIGVWTFKRNEVIFGDVPYEQFTVTSVLTDTMYNVHLYEVGKEYFITTTNKWNQHFKFVTFSFVRGMHINLTDLTDFTWCRGFITFPDYATREGIIDYFKNLANEYGYKGYKP